MQVLKTDILIPLYQQLCDIIRKQIETGEFSPGQRIPSEEKLIEMYNVSRVTVRNALKQLVEEDVLVKKHGKGTFVAMPAFIESVAAGGSFTESCMQTNVVPSTQLVSVYEQTANHKIAERLHIEDGANIICIKRLRQVDGVSAIFEVDYFSEQYNFLLHANLKNVSILELIRKNTGIVARNFEDVFEIKTADRELAQYLDCSVGYPLLRVKQVVLIERDEPLYYNEQFIRSDRYKYTVRSC